MVSAGAKTEEWIPAALPITWVTAIASPSARPRPSTTAAVIPLRVYGMTTPRTISQRVVPRASAPSSSSRGTARNSSRQMLEMIGTTMIVRINPAVKRPVPACDGAPNSGMNPRLRCSQGSTCIPRNGPSTKMPQRPRTTLGIAASISTSVAMIPRTPFGASSLR